MFTRIAPVLAFVGANLLIGCHPVPKAASSVAPSDHVVSGQALYAQHCVVCHGPRGNGNEVTTLKPPAPDLTSPKVATQLAPQLIKTVHEGKPDTAMGAWEQLLSDQDIEDVVAYLRHLRE